MTGKSLGFRTGSYGSLQQQQSNGVLHCHSPSAIVRKNSKVSLSSYREKERFRIFRYLCRRKVGMVILIGCALLAFLSSFWSVNKETPGSGGSSFVEGLPLSRIYEKLGTKENLLIVSQQKSKNEKASNSLLLDNLKPGIEIRTQFHPPAPVTEFLPPVDHPCNNFAFPPPPPNSRRRIGPRPCPVCYLSPKQAKAMMPRFTSSSPVLKYLRYIGEENTLQLFKNLNFAGGENHVEAVPHGGSEFGGYPSLDQRNDSFDIKESMTVNCGFAKGSGPGRGSGFNIDAADVAELEQYHDIIVASAIFGNYDIIQQPTNVSEDARKDIPFYMFIDEETEEYMRNSSVLGSSNKVGLWRIIVVHNIPYKDARRNGKVPKLLLHRLFPNVRYSIWIDGKLKLVADPYQVLERFLWRQNATFAISRHYRRFDVFVEAEANKAAGKYDNSSIDYQIDFYRKEGLTPYTRAKLPITSDVPEGCVIIREHIPITNLFTCLWFNEVDRFTSRDQLSFSTVRDKIMSKVHWGVYMFLDCERRNFVIQAYHRELLEHMPPPRPPVRVVIPRQPPPRSSVVSGIIVGRTGKRNPSRRGKDRRSGSKRHRKVAAGIRDISVF